MAGAFRNLFSFFSNLLRGEYSVVACWPSSSAGLGRFLALGICFILRVELGSYKVGEKKERSSLALPRCTMHLPFEKQSHCGVLSSQKGVYGGDAALSEA